ncbi:unnamed protein product [Urochloa decumbens]|uniref:Uncharacterized protein n=1 Tax=Urochloa decumbens TaxID=240449 RepID=A0ABC9FED0_9POAL
MGSCVSFSRSPAPAAESSSPRTPAATARVVNMDGSMAQVAVPATAREALLRASPSHFICSADELSFDAPPRALAAGEALRPGQLYFVLPASVMRRPLSGDDMAALAVRAATALAAEAGLAAGAVMSPQRRKKQAGAAAGKGRRRQSTARVAPVLVVSGGKDDDGQSDSFWNNDMQGGLTTGMGGKERRGAPYRRSARRHHRPGVQRLSAIAEDEE